MVNYPQEPENRSQPIATVPSFAQRYRRIRSLILDYALGNAIVGLNPFPGTLTLTLLVAGVVIIKMIRDIGSKWGYPKGQDILAIVGNVFGILGALAIAFMGWVTLFCLGLVIPPLSGFAITAALFTLTWNLGQITNQFYSSARDIGGEE